MPHQVFAAPDGVGVAVGDDKEVVGYGGEGVVIMVRDDDPVVLNVRADGMVESGGKDAIFSFQADRGSSYGAFCHMQSLLLRIYDEVRNEKAQEEYGKSLEELTAAERSRINYMLPICITEAEMKG